MTRRTIIALAALAAIAIPASAQLRKSDPPTELRRAPGPRELPSATPSPSPSPSPSPTPLVIYAPPSGSGGASLGEGRTLLAPCRELICDPAPPAQCDPVAFSLAVYAFLDSPPPVATVPVCEVSPHPSLVCASIQRSAERAAEEVAEQEYKRRMDEVRAHAARCRG